jgi:hypothetical protein
MWRNAARFGVLGSRSGQLPTSMASSRLHQQFTFVQAHSTGTILPRSHRYLANSFQRLRLRPLSRPVVKRESLDGSR